jgi:hypothetical protein
VSDLQALVGQRVTVHYNLHRCRCGGDPRPGESCFVLKRGGVSSRVAGYARTFELRDARLVVQAGGLRRVREQQSRAVMAYYVGTLVAIDGDVDPAGLTALAFNPFSDDTFVELDDRSAAVTEAQAVVGRGRHTWARLRGAAREQSA